MATKKSVKTEPKKRVLHAVDDDADARRYIARYKSIRSWMSGAEDEMDELKGKIDALCEEYDANVLTVDDIPVVRTSDYDRSTVDGPRFKLSHPLLYKRFINVVRVHRITIL